jgi:hypothetical protein
MSYDARAIKLPKQVKRSAAFYTNRHQRGEFIRSYVRILERDLGQRSGRRERGEK